MTHTYVHIYVLNDVNLKANTTKQVSDVNFKYKQVDSSLSKHQTLIS